MGALESLEARFPHVTRQAMLAKKKGRLAHAYLVHSDSEAIREGFATALAMTAACPNSDPEGRPCEKCATCRQIESGAYAEMFRLSPSSKSRIIPVGEDDAPNTVRWFENKFYFTSVTEAGVKIGVISDADRMQQQAQNMFLKTLEEPPRASFFILCTGNPMELLPTIRSRCQKILLLENRREYDFDEAGALFDALFELQFKSAGSLPAAERAAQKIIGISDSLYKQAEAVAGEKWRKRLEDAKKLAKEHDMEEFKKTEETRFLAAVESEYLRLRSFFLSALHTWFAQSAMLAEQIPMDSLPNKEIFEGRMPGPTADPEKAFKALEKADNLARTLDWNVNEELALREFCVSVAML